MAVIFLETADSGLRWMHRYYAEHTQLSSGRVLASFRAALDRLEKEPFAGRPYEDFEAVRELTILRSPFSILFTSRGEHVFIIDVRDQRGLRSYEALRAYAIELSEKYGL